MVGQFPIYSFNGTGQVVPHGNILAAKAGNFLGKVSGVAGVASGIFQNIIGKKTIDRTIGAAFKDGLKCWGASRTPSKAKAELPELLAQLGQMAQGIFMTESPQAFERAVNAYFVDFYKFRPKDRAWLATTAKDCTKKGLQVYVNGYNNWRDTALIPAIKKYADHKGYRVMFQPKYSMPLSDNSGHSTTVMVESVKVTQSATAKISSAIGTPSTKAGGGMLIGLGLLVFFGRKFIKK